MEFAGHHRFKIEYEADADAHHPSRSYAFNVSDDKGKAFQLVMVVTAEFAGEPGRVTDDLASSLGMRWVRGMIDLGLFERGGDYRQVRGPDWDPLFGDKSLTDEDLRFHLLSALQRSDRALQDTSRFHGIDPVGIAEVLGVDPTRVRDVFSEVLGAGEAESHMATLGQGAIDGSAQLTSLGVMELRRFREARVHRGKAMAAVLFTDLVDSTRVLTAVGDTDWRQALGIHADILEGRISERGGRVVKWTGDGVLARFTSPMEAIQVAQGALADLGERGLPARAGIHFGYVEEIGEDIVGKAVNLAARVMGEAEARRVLVSNVVRDLCTSQGLQFTSVGVKILKGIDEPVELFEPIKAEG